MTVETMNSGSMSLTALGAAIVWQSTLLAGIVAGVCWLLRRQGPAIRYWCWQVVALKLLVMPWWILALPLPSFFETGSTAAPSSLDAGLAVNHNDGTPALNATTSNVSPIEATPMLVDNSLALIEPLGGLRWHSWLVLLWLAGVTWLVVRLFVQRQRLQRLLRQAVDVAGPDLLALVNEVAAQLGLRRPPRAVFTDVDESPFVCGLLRPVLVLPRGLMGALDARQWREVLLHELAHIRRGDLWWGWIPEIARLVYFFHPVAHWVCVRIRLERELACDQLAMALGSRSPSDYAMVLVQVVSHASMPPVLRAAASALALDGGEKRKTGFRSCQFPGTGAESCPTLGAQQNKEQP